MAEWTDAEKALAATALYGVYRDVQTTHDFLERGEPEKNPLLGENPSRGKVNAAGALAGLGGLLAANALPDKYRAGFLGAWAGMEHALASQNKDGKKREKFGEVIKKPALVGLATGALSHLMLSQDDDSSITIAPDSITYTKKF